MSYVEAQAQGYFAMGGTTEAAYIFNDGNALFDVCKMPTTQKTARDPISRDLVLGTLRGVAEMLNENVIA
jgi:hypothetical protein